MAPDDHKTAIRPIEPRVEQVEALAALHRAFAVHDRTLLVMACGTGKTFVGRWHAQAIAAGLTLVFAPSLALLAQTLGEWRRVHGWPIEALVVCSDPTTAAGAAERRRVDDDVEDVPDWATVRARVTTDPARAARFLADKVAGRPQVVFSTYHSAPVVAEALAAAHASADLLICDEAHHLAGRPRQEFRTVLDQRAIPARRRLFMTATPQNVAGEDAYSMDDEAVFGPRAHTVTFGQAIAAGRLADYQVLVVAGRAGERSTHGAGASGVVPAALLEAIDRHGIHRMLTFHSRNARAAALAELVDAVKTPAGRFVRARHVHGTMPTADRAEFLRWLGMDEERQVRVVTSARCLKEGVDVPAVDGVLFADESNSVTAIIQAIGRVLRPAPGKTRGSIIIPVTLPADGDDDSNLATSAFARVWAVLRGLRAHDERFADEVDRAYSTVAGGRMCARRASDRVDFILPDSVDGRALELRLVQEVGSAWMKFFLATEDWAVAHGGKMIGRNTSHHHIGIGEWCYQQRAARTRGMLSKDRVARLERIPGWYWNRDDAEWADTVKLLHRFAAQHGDVAESPRGESRFAGMHSAGRAPQRRLGAWMALQRQLFRDGMLGAERAALLAEVPGWAWDAGLAAEHVEMIQALRLFGEFEKHAHVPEGRIEKGLPLGRWVWAIRRAKLLGTIPPALLDEISAAVPRGHKSVELFSWERNETQWRLMYSAIREYARREGQATPTGTYEEDFAGTRIGLGQWVARQRFLYRRGELEDRYIGYLEALPGWVWDVQLGDEYGEPLDLGGSPHGTAKGIQAKCRCKECVDARRSYDREHVIPGRRPTLSDPVPAALARHHLDRLELAGVKRGAIVDLSGVPLGTIRKVINGEWTEIERKHADAIRALTVEGGLAAATRVGSRGRMVLTGNELVDAGPTWAILDDLRRRGFGMTWVCRELGYASSSLQIRRDRVSQRIADQIEALGHRVGNLTYPASANRRVPPLAELKAAARPFATAS